MVVLYDTIYINAKKQLRINLTAFTVVPPGIEPGTQGPFIDNVSPLLYQLSYGTMVVLYNKKKSHSEE